MRIMLCIMLLISSFPFSKQIFDDLLSSLDLPFIHKVDYLITSGAFFIKMKFDQSIEIYFPSISLNHPINLISKDYANGSISKRKEIRKDNLSINGKKFKAIVYQDNLTLISKVCIIY